MFGAEAEPFPSLGTPKRSLFPIGGSCRQAGGDGAGLFWDISPPKPLRSCKTHLFAASLQRDRFAVCS